MCRPSHLLLFSLAGKGQMYLCIPVRSPSLWDPGTESPSLWANVAQESIRVGYEEEGSGKHTCLDFWSGIQKHLSISDSGLGFSDSK